MSKLVQMKLGNSTVLVEAPDDVQSIGGGDTRLSIVGDDVIDALDKTYDELVQNEIVENCRVLTLAFDKLREQSIAPSKATAEFGLQFTGEGNIYLVKASAQASITITVEWQLAPASGAAE